MKQFFRPLAVAGLLVIAASAAQAQQAAAVQQSPSRLDAGQVVFAPAPSINQAQTTITIPAIAGMCAYVDSLIVSLGEDATAATGIERFTTTNLGGVEWSFFPVVIVTSPVQPYMAQQLVGSTPLRAASCGVAVTIVSPAQQLHSAYPMMVQAHYAP